MSARLFPDFAAVPTPTERRAAHNTNRRAQLSIWQLGELVAATACPVCSGEHAAERCPHGTAPTLPVALTH